ncbi:unnamed protein product [Mytilus edulis]|uniref:Uncharacterized protein n=1 Tax=Mytilus edulis TaxID=6550 RepID=A0A8S3V0B9_MYTED|nr:unnamed protein product [Mytilus edulis]
MWLHGPTRTIGENSISETEYQLQDPTEDKEVRNVSCLKTKFSDISNMGSQRFDRFSDWNKLVGTIARLQHIADSYQSKAPCHHGRGWHLCRESLDLVNSRRAEMNIIKAVQAETYTDELLSCWRTFQSEVWFINAVMEYNIFTIIMPPDPITRDNEICYSCQMRLNN